MQIDDEYYVACYDCGEIYDIDSLEEHCGVHRCEGCHNDHMIYFHQG